MSVDSKIVNTGCSLSNWTPSSPEPTRRSVHGTTLRDTAVYSVIAAEWPAVQANLEWQLARPRRAAAE